MSNRPRNDQTPETKSDELRPDTRKGERVSMAKSQILDSQSRAGYARRWINLDVVGRREQLEKAWWTPVKNAEGSEMKIAKNGCTMLLMEIPLEYFNEDISAGQSRVAEAVKENQRLAKDEYTPDNRAPLTRDSVV